MTLYRARKWGQSEWTLISVGGDQDPDIEAAVNGIIGSALASSSLHVQTLSSEGVWENLER